MEFLSRFDTPYGVGAVIASAAGVRCVLLPSVSGGNDCPLHDEESGKPSALTIQIAGLLEAYFSGKRISFRDIPVDLEMLTPFRAGILNATRDIPYGEIRSYADLARMAGSPKAARAAGGALAANPVPVIIPCHRVVAADGRLTGFSAPGGLNTKKALLRLEGLVIKSERVCNL